MSIVYGDCGRLAARSFIQSRIVAKGSDPSSKSIAPTVQAPSILTPVKSLADTATATALTWDDFEVAVQELQRRSESEELQSTYTEAVVVRRNVLMQDVLDFFERNEQKGRVACRIRFVGYSITNVDPKKILGTLYAKSLPTFAHETGAGEVCRQVYTEILLKFQRSDLIIAASPRVWIGNGLKEPDGTIFPKNLKAGDAVKEAGDNGSPCPNFVVEFVVHHESLELLQEELQDWISDETSVMVAVGIIIFKPLADGTRQMLALVYRRNAIAAPEQSVYFGTDQVGVAGLELTIHLSDIYHGVEDDVPLQFRRKLLEDATVKIDLVELRERILTVGFHLARRP